MSSNSTDPDTSEASPVPETSRSAATPTSSQPPATSSIVRSSTNVPSPSSVVPPSSTAAPRPTEVIITSVVTQSPVTPGGVAPSPSIVVITSTETNAQRTSALDLPSSSTRRTSSSETPIPTGDSQPATKSGGLGEKGKIAVAVVVPIIAIALIIAGLLFFWKKRKARKSAEEQRRKEMEEYGFNPNNDPTIPPVSGAAYGDNKSEEVEDGVGYRGWGATNSSTGRGPSTNPGRSPGIGVALSDGGSNGGGHGYQSSPSNPTDRRSDRHSSDPLRPPTGESDVGALGGAPVAGAARQDKGIHRGASNASSAYSTAPRSEVSDDAHGGGAPGAYYHEDGPYHNDAQGPPGNYGDSGYGAPQPVIRDVQARRNTRIEKPTTYTQGNTGISQNF